MSINFANGEQTNLENCQVTKINSKFSCIGDVQPLVLGVSGGGDSVALLFLVWEYLRLKKQEKRIHVVTIDHGLRPDSSQEAEYVRHICHSYGIKHVILTWNGEKKFSGLSSKARDMRYNLLGEYALKIGARFILVGHTLDDQYETCYMRLQRGVGRGLSGMSELSCLFRKLVLFRPLLNTTRGFFRNFLLERGINWIEDPTNQNPLFERSRVRGLLTEDLKNSLQDLIDEHQKKRQNQNEKVASFFLTGKIKHNYDMIEFPIDWFFEQEKEEATFFLGLLLSIVGGRSYIVSRNVSKKVYEAFFNGRTEMRLNISRVVIEKWRNNFYLWREDRNIPDITLEPYEKIIWDNRFWVQNNLDERLKLSSLSKEMRRCFLKKRGLFIDRQYLKSLSTSLVITSKDLKKSYIPSIDGAEFKRKDVRVERCLFPFRRLISGYDEILYEYVLKLFKT